MIKVGTSLVMAATVIVFSLGLGSCASISSVRRAQQAASAANVRAEQANARADALAKRIAAMQARFSSQLADLQSKQMSLASSSAAAQAQALAAINGVQRTQQLLSAALADQMSSSADTSQPVQTGWLFNRVVTMARTLAKRPFIAPPAPPAAMMQMNVSAYNKLAAQAVMQGWPADSRFSLAIKPVGYLYHRGVAINLVRGTKIEPLRFAPRDFGIPASLASALPEDLATAGFAFSYPLNGPHQADEFLSFLGASYFRGLGQDQWWGLSARGIAVNTAVPNMQEEFPFFRSFWIVVPSVGADSITVVALLDGRSISGAYRFLITPGNVTTVVVTAVLFLRQPVSRLGLAPLTSMYLQGRSDANRFSVFPQEIHDSDGLSVETQAEQWLWQPLANPGRLRVRSFELDNPMGYGLMQRDRNFNDYQSIGAHYQDRPSAWVTFLGNWGRGHIELVEIPSRNADNDNVVAFWVPQTLPPPGQPLTLRYMIAWQGKDQTLPPLGWTTATHVIQSGRDVHIFSIDFSGGDLAQLPSWVSLQPQVRISGGQSPTDVTLVKLPTGGRWRLRFTVQGTGQMTIRAGIAYHGKPLTEEWNYST